MSGSAIPLRSMFVATLASLAACSAITTTTQKASVRYVIVAPLCSSVLPVEFSIDGQRVGADTFRVAVTNPHTISRAFDVTAGAHAVGARVVGGYVWKDTTMTVNAGSAVADSLPFYCS